MVANLTATDQLRNRPPAQSVRVLQVPRSGAHRTAREPAMRGLADNWPTRKARSEQRRQMQLDTIVVIARFDPVHAGHLQILERARELAPHVAILIGAANRPRSARHPWTVDERRTRIEAMWRERPSRLTVSGISDHLYRKDLWVAEVRARVADASGARDGSARIGLLTGPQQHGPDLQELFPDWVVIECGPLQLVDAQSLRNEAFAAKPDPAVTSAGSEFDAVRQEHAFLRSYWKQWSVAPYPVNFVTVDALVTHRDHLLVIRRRNQPGQGLLALPGGFLDVNEQIEIAAIRELREETGLDLPRAEALAALRGRACFDLPDRSLRGRTITHVFHFDLPGDLQPRVAAGDDAAQAEWIPVPAALRAEEQFFEDHFDIVEAVLRG